MIVLFSYDGDIATNKLIDWLIYYECDFLRINLTKEKIENLEIEFNSNKIFIKLTLNSGYTLNFDQISFFYTRGNGFNFKKTKIPSSIPISVYKSFLKDEFDALTDYFYSEVNKRSVGCFRNHSFYKPKQLSYASKIGLKIPKSLITNNNISVKKYFENKKIVTKGIDNNIAEEFKKKLYVQRVQRINQKSLPIKFYNSFFQLEQEKKFEIRTFYLAGNCYSIKIQTNSNEIDMRDTYNIAEYERYKLPQNIEFKIHLLMKKLGLTSGSIDFIFTKSNDYIFLEVNPNGQYDWVSEYGGYNLHHEIAVFLKNIEIKWKMK